MLDAFGHSQATAAMFADFGFEGLFVSRLSLDEKTKLQDERKSTFLWEPLSYLYGSSKQILTHVQYYTYLPPSFISTEHNGADPIVNSPEYMRFNLDKICAEFQNYTNTLMKSQQSKKNIAILMGDDFGGSNQYTAYKQLDAFVDYCNGVQKSNMTFAYSTPSKYLAALKQENLAWSVVRNHDFMPYQMNANKYWTGYFSSRPGLKKQVKDYSSLLHSQFKLFARKLLDQKSTDEQISKVKEQDYDTEDILTVLTHHDAITGTEFQFVAQDYAYRMAGAFDSSKKTYKQEIRDLINT